MAAAIQYLKPSVEYYHVILIALKHFVEPSKFKIMEAIKQKLNWLVIIVYVAAIIFFTCMASMNLLSLRF